MRRRVGFKSLTGLAIAAAALLVTPSAAQASGATPPWSSCPVFGGSPTKVIKTYSVKRGNPGGGILVPGQSVSMKCGATNGSDYGYFHIKLGKQASWTAQAAKTGDPGYTWMDMADFGITNALSDPDKQVYTFGADKWCYSRTVYLFNKKTGQVAGTTIVRVIFGNGSRNLITAYPNSAQCAIGTVG